MPEGGRFDRAGVERHYAALAGDYGGRANRACAAAYGALVRRLFSGCREVVEVGSGSSRLLEELTSPRRCGFDLSLAMLAAAGRRRGWLPSAADAGRLPLANGVADGLFAINVVEHLPEPTALVREAARVLRPGGRLLLVTPNGDSARLLELLERLHLKLPEGPHRFLDRRELAALAGSDFRIAEQRRFLAFPAGPESFVRAVDRTLGVGASAGRGLFQYVVMDRMPGGRA